MALSKGVVTPILLWTRCFMDGRRETNKRREKTRASLHQPGAERTRGGNVTSAGADVGGGTASRAGLAEGSSKACRGLRADARQQDLRSHPSHSSVGLAWVRSPVGPAGRTGFALQFPRDSLRRRAGQRTGTGRDSELGRHCHFYKHRERILGFIS